MARGLQVTYFAVWLTSGTVQCEASDGVCPCPEAASGALTLILDCTQAALWISCELCKCIVYNVVRASRPREPALRVVPAASAGVWGDLPFKPQGCISIVGAYRALLLQEAV